MILKTIVKNNTDVTRQLRWTEDKAYSLAPKAEVVLEGAYPTACPKKAHADQLQAEVESGLITLTILTDLNVMKTVPDEPVKKETVKKEDIKKEEKAVDPKSKKVLNTQKDEVKYENPDMNILLRKSAMDIFKEENVQSIRVDGVDKETEDRMKSVNDKPPVSIFKKATVVQEEVPKTTKTRKRGRPRKTSKESK